MVSERSVPLSCGSIWAIGREAQARELFEEDVERDIDRLLKRSQTKRQKKGENQWVIEAL
jgi:hypothetical protein